MASVTFPVELGGDGNTYTDDTNPNTGLANDGHRIRFIPCIANLPPMLGVMVQTAQQVRTDRLQTASDAAKAVSARSAAETSANTANSAAESAELSAQQAAAIYPTVIDALEATNHDGHFKIVENGYLQLYRNNAGAAKPLMRLASEDTLRAVQRRPDPLLTALLFF